MTSAPPSIVRTFLHPTNHTPFLNFPRGTACWRNGSWEDQKRLHSSRMITSLRRTTRNGSKAILVVAVVVVATVVRLTGPMPRSLLVHAFSTNPVVARQTRPFPSSTSPQSFQLHHQQCRSFSHSRHQIFIVQEKRNKDDTDNSSPDRGLGGGLDGSASRILQRFSNPIIDDPAMPLTEAGLVQIVAPTMQLFWLVNLESPYPSWAQPLVDTTFTTQGAFVAPTLIHGAGLACCWLLGCLAAKAYEKPNFRFDNEQGGYTRIVSSTVQAGAFACGILILATQIDLYQEFHGYVQLGESALIDARIYRALVEVVNDIFFEFMVLLSWRLFRSNFD